MRWDCGWGKRRTAGRRRPLFRTVSPRDHCGACSALSTDPALLVAAQVSDTMGFDAQDNTT